MQNGLGNVPILKRHLDGPVHPGVVMFNVYRDESGRYNKATQGNVFIGVNEGPQAAWMTELQSALAQRDEILELRTDIEAVQAGKLLLNLNNGVCAATGLSIAGSMQDRHARRAFALSITEGLDVMKAAGITPAQLTVVGPKVIAFILSLPNWLVFRIAGSIVTVTEGARSSTLQDLERGKTTEIGDLNGEVVEIAERIGRRAPINQTIVDVVRGHEAAVTTGQSPSFVPPTELVKRMMAARTG